ncbi:peptide/nickel transport system ATP-binding protein [Brevibacterium sp. 239c]|uniref:ABC transporter ATP-binding protein n=1 Tax=Brevibacterium sp. 239c TaxID=1965356 RepID=UPI000C63F663|nr:ABC transporter ATP-binding protein [Brevibacterium sp. 239c]SMX94877.1 peptide/nickel transport system ATP-binding protein [Brevibacterium sp. 239c]
MNRVQAGGNDALAIEGMDLHYGSGNNVVSDVSLTVGSSEIVGLIGESGSGKSSIAHAALGLLPDSAVVSAERLEVAGRDMIGAKETEWAEVRGRNAGMVFQEPMTALNPCVRIGDQIAEALYIHGHPTKQEADARALELLEAVRMPDAKRRIGAFPHELSGGQRQRVVIAMAMVAGPRLLVADEATTALDVTVQAQILKIFRDLRDETGIGILFISHDLGIVSEVCDRVAVMYQGRIVERGRAAAVLDAPEHPYTRALLESLPRRALSPRSPLATIDAVRRQTIQELEDA